MQKLSLAKILLGQNLPEVRKGKEGALFMKKTLNIPTSKYHEEKTFTTLVNPSGFAG